MISAQKLKLIHVARRELELTVYSDEIGIDSEAKWHLFRAKRQCEKSERSDAGNLFIT
jgi:hypothetical protein